MPRVAPDLPDAMPSAVCPCSNDSAHSSGHSLPEVSLTSVRRRRWQDVLTERVPPLSVAVKRRRRLGLGGFTRWVRTAELAEPERASYSAAPL